MNKKYWVYLALLIGLSACSEQKEMQRLLNTPACIEGQSVCQIETRWGAINVGFNVAHLIAEQPYEMHITATNPNLVIASGYMEGVNMYMGKIPLFFKAASLNPKQFIASSMFGSCAEKEMQWQVWLNVADQSRPEETQQVSIIVTSYQSLNALNALKSIN